MQLPVSTTTTHPVGHPLKPNASPAMPETVPAGYTNGTNGHANGATNGLTNGDAKAAAKKAARRRFEDAFTAMRHGLMERFTAEGMPPEAQEWYLRNLNYNVPGGKLNRGLSVVDSAAIIKGRELTEDEYFKAALLGWCVELLQAYFLVADDMMDMSFTRRGQPCWFRVDNIGNVAINDSFMLEAAIYDVLKAHFRREPYYADLLELFHDITYKTEMGQLIDLITAPEDHVDLSRFSLKKHSLIVIYKTAFYSFYLPVALAMLFCGIESPSLLCSPAAPKTNGHVNGTNGHVSASAETDPYKLALDILVPLGEYFQVQDDFLDYAGTPEQIGKIGTDIIDNKCSWCVNTALALCTPEQRAVLDANYGRKDAAAEARVKALYEELGIREKYAAYEEDAVARIRGLIQTIPEKGKREEGLKREVFEAFLGKIYKRTK